MFYEHSVLHSKNVGGDQIYWKFGSRVATMEHHQVSFRHNDTGLPARGGRKGSQQIEQSVATRFDERAVLNVTSHGQDDAELCVTAHHPRECFLRSFEWIGFNHGAHATQLGEAQGVLGIRWCSHRRALDGTLSADEL